MPLFGHKNQPEAVVDEPQRQHDDHPNRKRSLLSRRHRSTSPNGVRMDSRTNENANGNQVDDHNTNGHSKGTRSGGFFSRRRSHSSPDGSMGRGSNRSGTGTGLGFNSSVHGRHLNDPSVMAARQKVTEAEEAEHQADRALVEARQSVREAKELADNLEREIEEEARMYRLKQQEAKEVSKSAKGLGRHG